MTKLKTSLTLFMLLAGLAVAETAPRYDLYIAAAINKGYVIGSTIVTTNGLFRRDEQGEWQHFGYNDTSIRGLAFDPRDRRVIYTAANNGCWRSLDGGKTWRITTSWDMTEPLDVTVDPNAPDTVYLALPDGIAVSPDRGQTWPRRESGLPERGKYTQVVAVDRTQAGRVLAGCESGIYLTENAAKQWTRVLPTATTVDDIVQSPHDSRLWVAVTQSNGAWRSRDRGQTWTKLAGVPSANALYNVIFDPTNPKRLAIGSWTHGILTSEDGGETWVARNTGIPAPHKAWRIAVDPGSGQLYASIVGAALYSSVDFGHTWKSEGFEDSVIQRFVFLPASAK
jgi:hypothetical protein